MTTAKDGSSLVEVLLLTSKSRDRGRFLGSVMVLAEWQNGVCQMAVQLGLCQCISHIACINNQGVIDG